MKYFLGSLSTLIILIVIGKYSMPKINNIHNFKLEYRQSHIFEIVKPILPPPSEIKKKKDSQSNKLEEKTNIKVIIMNGQAFWIKDNVFYVADMNGPIIDKDTTRRVDTMGMDKVELDRMLFIMDQLTDRKINDSGSSGN